MNDESVAPTLGKDVPVYAQVAKDNTTLVQRIQAFARDEKEELPAGTTEIRALIQSRGLRCCNCTQLFFHPITFQQCGHTLCPQCIIQALHNINLADSGKQYEIPSLQQLLETKQQLPECACPACDESERAVQKLTYNINIDRVVNDYIQANQDEVIGAISADPKCQLCHNDITCKSRNKPAADDDEQTDYIDFCTDYCCYCQRYCCQQCQGDEFYREKYGGAFLTQIDEVPAAYINQLYQALEVFSLSTMNEVELTYIFEHKSPGEVWDELQSDLKHYFLLPIKICSNADRYVDAQMKVCNRCLVYVLNVALHYARAKMRNGKPICLCGTGCQLQFLSQEHKKQCQHFGKGTRGDQIVFSIWG